MVGCLLFKYRLSAVREIMPLLLSQHWLGTDYGEVTQFMQMTVILEIIFTLPGVLINTEDKPNVKYDEPNRPIHSETNNGNSLQR